MPSPQSLDEEFSARRAREREGAHREQARGVTHVAVRCLGWCALGLFFVMWSAHLTDVEYGRIALYGGLVIGNGGILFTLISTFLVDHDAEG